MASFWTIAPTIAAWTLGVLGLLLILSGFFRDRARGRKRCPRCWYDMSGAPSLQCPECGRTARSARQLTRTRRHWRRTLLGLFLATFASPLVTSASRLQREGATAFAPTTILVGLARFAEAAAGPPSNVANTFTDTGVSSWAAEMLLGRIAADDIFVWQRTLSWHAAHDRISADLDLDPPVVRAVMVALLTQSDRSVDPASDPRCRDLMTVKLVGPLQGTVGLALPVQFELVKAITSLNRHNIELQADGHAERALLIGSNTPRPLWGAPITTTVYADLGPPPAPTSEVWINARIWRPSILADDAETAARPADVVRRIRISTQVLPREGRSLSPVTTPTNPFGAKAYSFSFEHVVPHAGPISGPLRGYQVRLPPLQSVPKDVAVGVRIEVLRNDEVICAGRACASSRPAWTFFPWGRSDDAPSHLTWQYAYMPHVSQTDLLTQADLNATVPSSPGDPAEWKLRITSDEYMASWHDGATKYWVGEVVLPFSDPPFVYQEYRFPKKKPEGTDPQ